MKLLTLAAATALLASTLAQATLSAGAATSTSMAYRAVQSTYVSSAYPTKNFVGSKVLYTAASPIKVSYLTFDLTGVPATIQSASLQIWARTSSTRGFAVHVVSAPWTDSTITYRNAPAYGPTVASSGAITSGHYVSVDVTSLAVGAQRLDLALTSTASESFNGVKASSSPPRLLLGIDPPAPTPQLCGTGAPPATTYAHVVWIWMENRNYANVIGNSAFPYVNGTLIAGCGLATNYHNISHPSLPNYLAASQGSVTVSTDCLPAACPQTATSIFDQLTTADLPWKAYEESMATSCQLADADPYEPKHNPPVYYPALGTTCTDGDVPMGTPSLGNFAADLGTGNLPAFSFVTPNECDDGHDCLPQTADTWLSYWFPLIAASPAYSSTAVFLTWDEGSTKETTNCAQDVVDAGCHVATVVIAPGVTPGTTSATLFNHYSLLATTEQLLGLPDRLGLAADPTTTTMTADFGLLAPPPAP